MNKALIKKLQAHARHIGFGVARNTNNRHLAEDAESEALTRGLEMLQTRSWTTDKNDIVRAMVSAARRYIYNETKQEGDDDIYDLGSVVDLSVASSNPEVNYSNRQVIERMIKDLDNEQQEIFIYYWCLGMTQADIANLLGITQQATQGRISVIYATLLRFGQKNGLKTEKIFEVPC